MSLEKYRTIRGRIITDSDELSGMELSCTPEVNDSLYAEQNVDSANEVKRKSIRGRIIFDGPRSPPGQSIKSEAHKHVAFDDTINDSSESHSVEAPTEKWTQEKTFKLIELVKQNLPRLNDPEIRSESVWNEIAIEMNSTLDVCRNKMKYLKQRYVKSTSGAGPFNLHDPSLTYFDELEEVIALEQKLLENGPVATRTFGLIKGEETNGSEGVVAIPVYRWSPEKIRELIRLYKENLPNFNHQSTSNESVWKSIAGQMGISTDIVRNKFKYLKTKYMNYKSDQLLPNPRKIKFSYFNEFDEIFADKTNEAPRKKKSGINEKSLKALITSQNATVQLLRKMENNQRKRDCERLAIQRQMLGVLEEIRSLLGGTKKELTIKSTEDINREIERNL